MRKKIIKVDNENYYGVLRMRISVVETTTNQTVKLEVEQNHTVGSVIETVIDGLGLSRDRSYVLTLGEKELGADKHSLTLEAAGIRDGDTLELMGRPIGG